MATLTLVYAVLVLVCLVNGGKAVEGSSYVAKMNGPGCSEASIKSSSECQSAAESLGFKGQLHVGSWDHAPPGCHVGHPADDWSHIYFNEHKTGRLMRPIYQSICHKNAATVEPEALALAVAHQETFENSSSGFFFGSKGGRIKAYPNFRVGLTIDIKMQIKPRNTTGLLLAVRGRKDYCILEMVNGEIIFRVENGRGPMISKFTPKVLSHLSNGDWHEIHAIKTKNVVTISVDNIFAENSIGLPGVSSTDTNHPLFIGGHARPDRIPNYPGNFEGCIRSISIDDNELVILNDMLVGDVTARGCPVH